MALPDYLQDQAKDFARQLTASTSVPINTGTFTGRQFVAGEDQLQTDAITAATQGLGSYKPFLTQAQTLTGTGMPTPAGVTPGSIQDFMSPYQGAVIDETLRQYDLSRQGGLQDISQQAYTAGAFGGGRQGALQGQYMADTQTGRAGIVAQLNQQAFQDAAARRAQAMQNQFALSNFQRSGLAGDVASLGNLGAFRQGLNQQQLGELSEQDFLALTKRFDALPQSEKDNIDKLIGADMDKQTQQFIADEKKFGSFSDGRTLDIGAGKIAYNDLLAVFKNDYPAEFAKLTGLVT